MQENKKAEREQQLPASESSEWNTDEIAEQSSNQMPDEILRQVLRGDESKGSADHRDIVGGSATIDTPQGREEAKTKDRKS